MGLRSCSKSELTLILLLTCGAISLTSTSEHQSDEPELILPSCPRTLSCKDRCSTVEEEENGTKSTAHCHCDPQCEKYRDCCADYRKFCITNQNISASFPSVHFKHMACVKTNTEKKISVWMVVACEKDWPNDNTKQRCLAGSRPNRTFTSQTIAEDVPVMDILHGVHYRNKYCLLCNNVPDYYIHYWNLRIRCNIKPPEEYSLTEKIDFLLKYCPTRYKTIEKYILRRLCYDTVSTCSEGATSVHHTRCEQGPTHVVTYMRNKEPKQNYKNLDCLLCNGLKTENAACGPRESHGNIFNPKSFEVVMKLQTTEDPTTEFQLTCKRNFVYDNHLQVCRAKSHKMDPSKAVSDKYRFKVWLSPLDGAQPENFTKQEFLYAFTRAVDITPSQVTVLKLGSEDMSVAVTFDAHAQSFNATVPQTYEDSTNTSLLNRIGVQELLKPNASFVLAINQRTWSVLKLTWRQLACIKMDTYSPGEFVLFPNNNSMLINKTGEILPIAAYYLKDDSEKAKDQRTAYVCRSTFTAFCPHHFVPIKKEDYTILTNGSLDHTRTGTQFPSGEYYIDSGFGVVCTNDTERFASTMTVGTKALQENVVLRYMTIVGMSVSVLFLLLVLFTHFLFPDLRSPLPGKNLMNLSLSLLLAHFMYLLGSGDTDKPTFCRVIAIVLHWLFLVSFTCMAIIAHDTRATFSRKMSKVQSGSIGQSHTPRFLAYSAVAWGGPLLLVVVCVLLDRFSVFDIGYGGHRACWIAGDGTKTQRNAQLVVFAAPVGCTLVYNVFAFSQTIWAISVARQQTHRLNKAGHNNPNMVKIYIRLLSLMGFSWFFGFSAAYIHEALMYPFVFFSTLQGLYLFLAFVCKARVWRMYKDKFSRNRKTKRHSTAYTTSTTTDCRSLKPTKLVEESNAETNM